MTDFIDQPGTTDACRVTCHGDLNTVRSPPPANQPKAMPTHVPGRALGPHGNFDEQPPAELVAHLVVALSRYVRQLRVEGGRAPAQIEISFHFLPIGSGRFMTCQCSTLGASCPVLRRCPDDADHQERGRRAARCFPAHDRALDLVVCAIVHGAGAARVRVADLEAYVQGLEADGRPDPSRR